MNLRTMMIWVTITVTAAKSGAQVISPMVPEPTSANASLDHTTIKAGESAPFALGLNVPAPRDLSINGSFSLASGTDYIGFDATCKKGDAVCNTILTIPQNADGGDYVLTGFQVQAEKRPIHIPLGTPLKLHVEPLPKFPELLPSNATAEITLNQRQYIRMQAEPLQIIRDNLVARLDKQANDTPDLRRQLLEALELADSYLPTTEKKYVSLYATKPSSNPVLFDDLHNRYQALLIDLRAATTANYGSTEQLLLVQLVQRQKTRGTGTYPPVALATLEVLNWNIVSYLRIASTGIETFSIGLSSRPIGATVSFKKIGADYTPLGQQTNMTEFRSRLRSGRSNLRSRGAET